MKAGFYPKLALTGMKKNKRLYLPYILTCIGMIMMHYIITFLSDTPVFSTMRGNQSLQVMLDLGSWIIAIFSTIFLFYTNSFLMRRRKKEFGLYNILGMDKFNISKILLWESIIVAVFSLVAGLGFGIVFSKFAELGLINIMKSSVSYAISVSVDAVIRTLISFCIIFLLILVNSLIRVKLSNPVEMLRSENFGEKKPKGNFVFALIGLVLLGAAYYLAVSIKDPLSALAWFFIAVIMVILGTYLLFITGSVVLCRILQKNKKYYYKANHFVSVSSMAYRMKRNGAGLASICILGTMVLVMIASTSCLYFGEEDALNKRFPRDIMTEVAFHSAGDMNEHNLSLMKEKMNSVTDKYGANPKDDISYSYGKVIAFVEADGKINTDVKDEGIDMNSVDDLYQLCFISLEDYNKILDKDEKLKRDEAMIYVTHGEYNHEYLGLEGGKSLKVIKVLGEFIDDPDAAMNIIPTLFVVVDDFENCVKPFESSEQNMMVFKWIYGFDTSISDEKQMEMYKEIGKECYEVVDQSNEIDHVLCESLAYNKEDFYSNFGGLFFLGIMLSIVFLFAAVLIIYYKQISEGYEDKSRFEIMQKVGMTKREIRKSINSQILVVFFLPLIAAGCHLAFAFPLIQKLLMLFNLINTWLLVLTTAISFLIFAMFYMIVYRITSNGYYKIVSENR